MLIRLDGRGARIQIQGAEFLEGVNPGRSALASCTMFEDMDSFPSSKHSGAEGTIGRTGDHQRCGRIPKYGSLLAESCYQKASAKVQETEDFPDPEGNICN